MMRPREKTSVLGSSKSSLPVSWSEERNIGSSSFTCGDGGEGEEEWEMFACATANWRLLPLERAPNMMFSGKGK